MARKTPSKKEVGTAPAGKPSSLVDTRVIYCGDNLQQLRKLPDACVDLIYIDPPFNSNRNYEVFWGETKEKRAFEDRHGSTAAYIDFMRPRCVELARVLKKTGSFYYHCDWHASHYVKVMLDQIMGENCFQAEIVWKRTTAHGDTRGYGHITDSIFFYSVSDDFTWNKQTRPYAPEYVEKFYRQIDPATGKRFMLDNMTGAGIRHGETGQPWRGIDVTAKHRHWIRPPAQLEEWDKQGLIYWPKKGGTPRFKRFLDEDKGNPLDNTWNDIPAIGAHSAERLGYPTQKPVALLERIIIGSSNKNDIVLDAFCGCGTALVAAENLGRQWIGIDISPTACRVMGKRLRDVCHIREDEKLWRIGRGFVVRDLPWTVEQLRKLPPFEFENWAVIALGGIPNKAQVGDMGIDGRIYPVSAMPIKDVAEETATAKTQPGAAVPQETATAKTQPRAAVPQETTKTSTAKTQQQQQELEFMDQWYPIQVKQKDKAGRPEIDAFETAMNRAKRAKGFFIAFDFSADAMWEISRYFTQEHKVIVPLKVQEILDEHIAQKLA